MQFNKVIDPVLHDLVQAQADLVDIAAAGEVFLWLRFKSCLEDCSAAPNPMTANLEALSLETPGDVPELPAPKRKGKAPSRGRPKKAADGARGPAGPGEGVDGEPMQGRVTRARVGKNTQGTAA